MKERRPAQTADLYRDPRVRYPQCGPRAPCWPRRSSWATRPSAPSPCSAPTCTTSPPRRSRWCRAFADQAAMALEHARLFSSVRTYSERLEAMVEARTHELDEQKRFVEVVLETLPLGLFVLDAELRVISANREGAALVPVGPDRAAAVRGADAAGQGGGGAAPSCEGVVAAREVRHAEEELPAGGETLTVRLTATPLPGPAGHPRPGAGGGHHAAEAARAADAADRAAHHRGAAGRRRGPRAEQPAGHHRGLRGGAPRSGPRIRTCAIWTPSRTSRPISR